jgi:hypothetical protein
MKEKEPQDGALIACYQGAARVRLRVYNYHGKGSTSAEMRIYPEFLSFSGSGSGLGRWQVHRYEIRRERIREIIATTSSGVPGFFEALGVCVGTGFA